MRKLLSFLLAALLLSVWMVPAQAAGTGIKMEDVALQESDIVYVAVSLEAEKTVTAMAVTYSYDSTLLRVLPEECRWIPDGALNDFAKTGNQAVWASDGAKKLSGDLCVLAFRVLKPQSFKKATVTCNITMENGSASSSYQASGQIAKICNHDFGDWTANGDLGHTRICGNCGEDEFQSHNWDQGVKTTDPQKPNISLLTYTCSECNHKKVEEITDSSEPSVPDSSKPSEPDEEESEPTRPRPTYPEEDRKYPIRPNRPSSGGSSSGSSGSSSGNSGSSSGSSGSSSSNSGSSSGSSNTGSSQNNSSQPQDYNQSQNSTVTTGTKAENENTALSGNASLEHSDEAVSAESTQPMAIKVDETEEDVAENSSEEETEKQTNGNFIIWFVTITVFAIGAACSIWWLTIKKKNW